MGRPTTVEGVRDALTRLRTPESLAQALAFRPEPGDVFVAAYPKCGTTWLQQIVHGLRTGGDMDFDDISRPVPWLESAGDLGIDLDALPRPRTFKTHFTRHELPEGARSVYIVRNPEDVAVSFFHFFEGWMFEPGSIDFDTFVRAFFLFGSNSGPYWAHVRSWWDARDQGDTLYLCFEDLKQDLPGAVGRIARFIDAPLDNVPVATEQATFAFMQAHGDRFDERLIRLGRDAACGLPPSVGVTKMRGGRTGDGTTMSADLRQALRERWRQVLPELADYAALRVAIQAR